MPELRLVLIVVGVIAIVALLLHGIWTNKKEGKAKFSEQAHQPLSREDEPQPAIRKDSSEGDMQLTEPNIHKTRSSSKAKAEPSFGLQEPIISDPLLNNEHDEAIITNEGLDETFEEVVHPQEAAITIPSIKIDTSAFSIDEEQPTIQVEDEIVTETELPAESSAEPVPEEDMQVIVLHVKCQGEEPFAGDRLFNSMERNGLHYGEMDIYHRHVDISGTGKVLFSVANMMSPGTLAHDDPNQFSTDGIAFFMTLPCFGEAEQNFKIMLTTAQMIANDLGGNVLDDQRNLVTPDRLAEYRRQVKEFDNQRM